MGASGAGVDPRATISLAAAIRELGPRGRGPGYDAGTPHDRRAGTGYGSDAEFLEALADAEEHVRERRADVHRLQKEAAEAAHAAMDDLGPVATGSETRAGSARRRLRDGNPQPM